jgi:hypothetical protein
MQPEYSQSTERRGYRVLLAVHDVADICGVSPRTVYRWVSSGELARVELPGTGARPILGIRPEDLRAFIDAGVRDRKDQLATDSVVTLNGRRYLNDCASAPLDTSGPQASRVPGSNAARRHSHGA